MKISAKNVDWEDIAIRGSTIFIADIGANKTPRKTVYIYKVTEPKTGSKASGSASKVTVNYADGKIHNAETLIADKSSTLWIVDKNKGTSNIWKVSGSKATKMGTVGFGKEEITGGDMSPDGSAVVLRTYNGIYVYKTNGDVAKTLKGKMCKIKFSDKNGEAIAFTADSKGLIATGETKGGGKGNMTLFN